MPEVPTLVVSGWAMSWVRYPAASTSSTARSTSLASSREIEGVAQHHGEAEQRGERVGEALAGDVGGGAVHRLVERPAAPRASVAPSDADGSMPSEPVSIAAQSDSMSPKRLSVTMTSNCLG